MLASGHGSSISGEAPFAFKYIRRSAQWGHALAGDACEQVLGDAPAKDHRAALRVEGVRDLCSDELGRVAGERSCPVAELLQRQRSALSGCVHCWDIKLQAAKLV